MAVPLVAFLFFASFGLGPYAPGSAAPGGPDLELIQAFFDTEKFSSINPIFFPIFQGLGVIPACYAGIISGGGGLRDQRVPGLPFLVASFFLGLFALGPYLFLRRFNPERPTAPAGVVEVLFGNRLSAAGLFVASLYLVSLAVPAVSDPVAVQGFKDLLSTSRFVSTSTLDLTLLSCLVADPMSEDMQRRGWELSGPKLAFLVPVVGPAAYLLFRPGFASRGLDE